MKACLRNKIKYLTEDARISLPEVRRDLIFLAWDNILMAAVDAFEVVVLGGLESEIKATRDGSSV